MEEKYASYFIYRDNGEIVTHKSGYASIDLTKIYNLLVNKFEQETSLESLSLSLTSPVYEPIPANDDIYTDGSMISVVDHKGKHTAIENYTYIIFLHRASKRMTICINSHVEDIDNNKTIKDILSDEAIKAMLY